MAYGVLQNYPNSRRNTTTTTGSVDGINTLVASEFTKSGNSINLENYIQFQDGKLEKRKGLSLIKEISGEKKVSMVLRFTSDIIVWGYDDTISQYTISTDTNTELKNNFTNSNDFEGLKYGDFVYATNGGDKIHIFAPGLNFLSFTGETGTDFAVGDTITDDSNTGSGTVQYVTYLTSTTGIIVLSGVTGTFDGGAITSSGSGTATGSTYDGDSYEATASPKASVIYQKDGRLYANDSENAGKVLWSAKDTDITEVPFLTWVAGSTPPTTTDANFYNDREKGEVKSFATLGSQIIVFFDDGKTGSRITTIDVDGTGLSQNVEFDFSREDFGGERGAVTTPKGVFYVNEGGVWQMLSGGNTNQPFSEQEGNTTRTVFDEVFINNIDFTDSSIIYDIKRNVIYISCAESSDYNNLVLWYNLETKSYGKFTNWLISRFFKFGNDIYAGGSRETKIWKILDGGADESLSINHKFEQEIHSGALDELQLMEALRLKGFFSQDSDINVYLDIYDKNGEKTEKYKTLTLNIPSVTIQGLGNGFNANQFNANGFGQVLVDTSPVETRAYKRVRIYKFTRIILRIEGEDSLPHNFTWIGFDTVSKGVNNKSNNLS